MLVLADVAVSVANKEASAEWWRTKIGFGVHTLEGAAHAVLVAPPGDRFVIHLCEEFEPVSPGNTGIAFVTDDLKGTVRRLRARGVAFAELPQQENGGRMAKFTDPDGNIFWLLGAPTGFVERAFSLRAAPPRAGPARSPGGRTRRTATPRARPAPRARGRSSRRRRAR